jgi:hypothetical protein
MSLVLLSKAVVVSMLYYDGFYQLCYRHSLLIPVSALINSQMF